jgi:4-amino-4-deoxy-L-arabinose transferase-like glycosyltransferase
VTALSDRWVIAAAAVVAALQLLYAFLADPVFNADGYLDLGQNFAHYWHATYGAGTMRTPGYPLLLAGLYESGLGATGLKIVQAAFITAGLLALARVTELSAGLRAARICAWLFVICIPIWSYSSIARTEAIAIPLLIFAVLALLLSEHEGRNPVPWLIATGFFSGLALIVRPNCVSIVAIIGAVALFQRFRHARSGRSVTTTAALIALPVFVIFAPWVVRNLSHQGSLEPLGHNPYPLPLGLHLPYETDIGEFASFHRSSTFFSEQRSDGFTPEMALESDSWEVLKDDLRSHTKEFFATRAVAEFQMWPWPATPRVDYAEESVVPYPIIMLIQVIILFAGLLGLYRLRRDLVGMIGLAFVVALFVIHLLYVALPRYTVPVLPFLIVGTAALFSQLWEARRGRVA